MTINNEIKQSDYTVTSSEAGTLYFTQKRISNLNITLGKIKFNPQVNALEVYEILQIPPEASSTTGITSLLFSLNRANSSSPFKLSLQFLHLKS